MAETITNEVDEDIGKSLASVATDFSSDKQAFQVHWGKAMMWIFLLSDTFIFSTFLIGYMTVRMSAQDPWPLTSEVFALSMGGEPVPLLLIAIMTFILITSSGTMALAVNMGYAKEKKENISIDAYNCNTWCFFCWFAGL